MTLIVHTDGQSDTSRRLISAVDATLAPYFLARNSAHLEKALHVPLSEGLRTLLYHATSAEAVDHLGGFLKRTPECKLLLVLPDSAPATLRLGFRCFPRFVTDQSSDFSDMASVIAKMYPNTAAVKRLSMTQ